MKASLYFILSVSACCLSAQEKYDVLTNIHEQLMKTGAELKMQAHLNIAEYPINYIISESIYWSSEEDSKLIVYSIKFKDDPASLIRTIQQENLEDIKIDIQKISTIKVTAKTKNELKTLSEMIAKVGLKDIVSISFKNNREVSLQTDGIKFTSYNFILNDGIWTLSGKVRVDARPFLEKVQNS